MLYTKIVIAMLVITLLLTVSDMVSWQTLSDAYALAETHADLPYNWESWPETNDNQRGERPYGSYHEWMGRREIEKEPVSPQNHILVSSRIIVSLCPTPKEARAYIEKLLSPALGPAVSPERGSYSGASLGDECFRSAASTNRAFLWFTRANAYFMVDISGPTGDLDYPVVVEKIARAMLARADAALALASSGGPKLLGGAGNVKTRQPQGVPVVLVDEWAASSAATLQADWRSGTATIKRGSHTLRLMIGRRDARLDGQPLTLPFPALRQGKDRLLCSLVVLNKLTG